MLQRLAVLVPSHSALLPISHLHRPRLSPGICTSPSSHYSLHILPPSLLDSLPQPSPSPAAPNRPNPLPSLPSDMLVALSLPALPLAILMPTREQRHHRPSPIERIEPLPVSPLPSSLDSPVLAPSPVSFLQSVESPPCLWTVPIVPIIAKQRISLSRRLKSLLSKSPTPACRPRQFLCVRSCYRRSRFHLTNSRRPRQVSRVQSRHRCPCHRLTNSRRPVAQPTRSRSKTRSEQSEIRSHRSKTEEPPYTRTNRTNASRMD
jgi:hypothetical protein